jgi:hypothetical protein
MRPVLQMDVTSAARALLDVAPDARPACIRRLIDRADAADRYRRRTRRAHPLWGNGTLMAAAMARSLPRQPRSDDPEFLDCQFTVVAALLERVGRPPVTHARSQRSAAP